MFGKITIIFEAIKAIVSLVLKIKESYDANKLLKEKERLAAREKEREEIVDKLKVATNDEELRKLHRRLRKLDP